MSAPSLLHSAYRAVEVRVRESLLLESAERAARSVSPPALQRAREPLAADDPLALDSRSSADLAVGRAAADESARWLTRLVEPRTPRQIRVRRSVHIGIVAAVALGALAWGVGSLFQAPNLALHRPVTISKRLPQSTWFDDGLPFFLEFSEDGTHFVEVDRRARGFTASAPWTYRAAGRAARYVRIRSDKYIAITEIEVYGSQ